MQANRLIAAKAVSSRKYLIVEMWESMIKPGQTVYVHGREAIVVQQSVEYNRKHWWIVTIAGKEALCPEDIMKRNQNEEADK